MNSLLPITSSALYSYKDAATLDRADLLLVCVSRVKHVLLVTTSPSLAQQQYSNI